MGNTRLEILTRTDPFEILSPDILKTVATAMETHSYEPGHYIFKQGDVSKDRLFIVADGLVEISIAGDDGQAQIVGMRRRYDFFGETVVLSRQRYPGSARAREKTRCISLGRRDLEALIYRCPEFSGFFNTLLAERMRLIYERLVADQSREELTASGALLFRRQVGEIMSSPPVSCRRDDRLALAAGMLAERNEGALVVLDAAGRPAGFLSARDVLRHGIVCKAEVWDRMAVAATMDCRIETIAPAASVARALARMTRRGVRRLLVMERDVPVGVISRTDLVKLYSAGALMLAERIPEQDSLEALARVGREVDALLPALLGEKAGIPEMLSIMSTLYEGLTRRALQLSEEHLARQGWGAPPVDYCWINMGSAARREQVFRTDQDNALIYATPPPENAAVVERYFERLAEAGVEALATCGFALCPGGVMARNAPWRRSLAGWMRAVDGWVASPDPEDTRILTILLDFQVVWGREELGHAVRDRIFAAFEESGSASHLLVRDDRQTAPPVSFLGTIVTDKRGPHKNRLNLKTAGLVHLVNGLRVLAVNNRVTTASSLERLETLKEAGVLSMEDGAFFRTCFETLMLFAIRADLDSVRHGGRADHYLDPAALPKGEQDLLKDALYGAARMQKLVGKRYGMSWLNFFS